MLAIRIIGYVTFGVSILIWFTFGQLHIRTKKVMIAGIILTIIWAITFSIAFENEFNIRVILLRIFYIIEACFAILAIVKLNSFFTNVRRFLDNLAKNKYKLKEDELKIIVKIEKAEKWAFDLSFILLIFFVVALGFMFANQK